MATRDEDSSDESQPRRKHKKRAKDTSSSDSDDSDNDASEDWGVQLISFSYLNYLLSPLTKQLPKQLPKLCLGVKDQEQERRQGK